MKIDGCASESGSGSISLRHGSADPDPDPHQNVMDPEHCENLLDGTLPILLEVPDQDPRSKFKKNILMIHTGTAQY
jgi:hypothetical protein